MDPVMFDYVPDDLQLNITSTISYSSSAPTAEGTPYVEAYENTVDDFSLAPVVPAVIGSPDTSITLNAVFATYDNGVNRASFQNVTYNSPLVPTVLTAMTTGSQAENVKAYGPSASVLEYGKVIELDVFNWDSGNHPFHLHGHKFALIEKIYSDPSAGPTMYGNLSNPMWRDTVHIPAGGVVRIRFMADNPGAWFFHCHIDWHFTSGLAWVMVEAPDYMQKWLQPPQYVYDQCTAGGFPISGNAAGHADVTDWKGLPLGPYPQVLGWTPKGIGAMFACVFSAVVGMATVVWYAATGMGDVAAA